MRLDQALVARQLVASRSLAQKLIAEGRVLRNGSAATKANASAVPIFPVIAPRLPQAKRRESCRVSSPPPP